MFYQANKKPYCYCSLAHGIILHPRPSNYHPALEVVCCWKYANQKVYIFASWNRWWLQHFNIRVLQVFWCGQAACNRTYKFEVTRNFYFSNKPRFQTLVKEAPFVRIGLISDFFSNGPHVRKLPLYMRMKWCVSHQLSYGSPPILHGALQ